MIAKRAQPVLCAACQVEGRGWVDANRKMKLVCRSCGREDRLDEAIVDATRNEVDKTINNVLQSFAAAVPSGGGYRWVYA